METQSADQLSEKKCVPCEGGVERCTVSFSQNQLRELNGWQLTADNLRIEKKWTLKHYVQGMEFLNQVALIAEADAHHPDVHLENYRNVRIEIWTHAIGGLSENDFILAAKIDQIKID